MVDLGIDYSLIERRRKSGLENLLGALVRRLQTPRGGLFYDPAYGFDLREMVQAPWNAQTQYELETFVQAAVEQDPRVAEVEVEAEQMDLNRVRVSVRGLTAQGPFALVLAVSGVSVEVLRANT
jgi:phage baseplate assembly protein W